MHIAANGNGQVLSSLRSEGTTREIATLGPARLPAQAVAVEFTADLKYPYTFTTVVANMVHGREGEGNFSI